MNTQHKKFLAIAAVVALHAGVITLMLAQHGCKSGAQQSNPPAAVTATPAPVPAPLPVADADPGFSAPTPPPEPAPVPVAQFAEPLSNLTLTPTPAPAAAPATVTWKVARGETLSSIAKKNGITVDELVAANAPKVSMTSHLQIGQVLTVPLHAAASAAASTAASTSAPATAEDTTTPIYKVSAGDTLSKIASKNGTTVKTLKEFNGLTSDNIREGEILKLPAPSGGAAMSGSTASASSPSSTAGATGATYVVQSGDTLGKIAARSGVKTAELMALNNFTDATARSLKPGQTLKLPASAHAPDAAASMPASLTPVTVTPTTTAPSFTPVTVTAVPASSTGSAPPVTPVNP